MARYQRRLVTCNNYGGIMCVHRDRKEYIEAYHCQSYVQPTGCTSQVIDEEQMD